MHILANEIYRCLIFSKQVSRNHLSPPLPDRSSLLPTARETSTTTTLLSTSTSTSTTATRSSSSSSSMTLPTSTLGDDLKSDFPALHQDAYPGKPLVYLDSAATSQKPQQVLNAMSDYYEHSNANVHRGAHALSIRATEAYEAARDKVQNFIHASAREEIIFTRGATEAINLVAYTWGIQNLKAGDEILLTVMEHHSNLVPWQLVAKKTGAVIKFVGLNEEEGLDLPQFHSLLSSKTKLVAFPHVSNTLGCILPVVEMAAAAHAVGALVLVDACQSIPHMKVDVQELDVDFLAASSHKMCGPTGAGFLYGKLAVLKQMPPWHGGGEMIDEVFFEYSTFAEPPARFEAGTPPIAEVVGMGAACDYLMGVGMEKVEEHEHQLGKYLYERLSEVEGVRIYGPPPGKEGKGRAALASFNTDQVHASDLAFFLDHEGVAIRSGHHCTQPLHRMLHAKGSLRASLYVYNTKGDVDVFITKLKETMDFFGNFQSGGAGASTVL